MNEFFTLQRIVKIGIFITAFIISCNDYAQTKSQNSFTKSTLSFLSAETPPRYLDKNSLSDILAHPVLSGSVMKSGNSLNSMFVAIIESESYNAGMIMDSNWYHTAKMMGYNAAIYPQTTLDNTNFFLGTDI